MKNFLMISALLLTVSAAAVAREYEVYGPQGGIAMDITLPKGFDPETGKCPMVILMYGIFSSGKIVPMPSLANDLAEVGIASISFDFGGHWRSEDSIVPLSCSERFVETYGESSELIVVEGGNHMITRKKTRIVNLAVEFFKEHLL